MTTLATNRSAAPTAAYSHFDFDHWMKVKAARGDKNYRAQPDLPGHPLAGKKVVDKTTGQVYLVQSVRKDWLRGWFLRAKLLVEETGSQRVCMVENDCCHDRGILREVASFQANFTLVS